MIFEFLALSNAMVADESVRRSDFQNYYSTIVVRTCLAGFARTCRY